jgi:dTDP-4-dehydrorhamnose reductase
VATPLNISSVEQLDELLSTPTDMVVQTMRQCPGDIMLLGIGGKMGPTLGRMIVRATQQAGIDRRVIGVSRFSNTSVSDQLNAWGIETIAGDLLNPDFINSLPDAPNVIAMAAMKFGTTGNENLTWAMNTFLPSLICRKYRDSRIAAFSTGNVYGLVPSTGQGSKETDTPAPIGEYAMSALGRERTYEYFCKTHQIPTSLIRLNYATELRYGVLVDLALQVYNNQPVDVSMGHVNVIWQGDANAMSICSLADAATPAFTINVAGPEILSTRRICESFADAFGKRVHVVGEEATDALLNDGSRGHERYGLPGVSFEQMLPLIVDWIQNDRPLLGEPTHFESRTGVF